MLHLGILGHSAEGAALCFTTFCESGSAQHGEHPDVTLDCISFTRCLPAYERGDYDAVRDLMLVSLGRLADAHADFFACPDNTVHLALERPGEPFPLPGLHIGEVVAERAARDGRRRVGILGTTYTMEGPIYPRELARHGIETVLPSPADRELVNDTIFGELVHGRLADETRTRYVRLIEAFAAQGCDAVALVCTEIPLLVPPEASPLPTLDSTRLLAQTALEVACGRSAMPTWRGGPLDA
jgi:aspartate racemase